MRSAGGAAIAVALVAATAVAALTPSIVKAGNANVVARMFVVTIRNDDGTIAAYQGEAVPYLPGQACYRWRIRLDHPPSLVRYDEVFTLPAAPETWGGEDRDYATNTISQDRRTSMTSEFAVPVDGWIEHGWCVADGDPPGTYEMAIGIDGTPAATFTFTLVNPAEPAR